jgi:hypothetical protein
MYLISDKDRDDVLDYLELLSRLMSSSQETKTLDVRRRVKLLTRKLQNKKKHSTTKNTSHYDS